MAAGSPVSMASAFGNLSTTQAGPIKKMAAIADNAAPTAFTAPASGAVTVTSAAAGDLTTTANAVATLRDEVATLTTKVNSLLAALRTSGALSS